MNYKIIVDFREDHSTSEIHNMTPRFDEKDIKYEKKQLDVGDYIVENIETGSKFCVERKIFSDLVGSIYNGRIFNELYKMNESFTNNFLIVVGDESSFYKERAKLKKMNFVKKAKSFSRNQLLGIMSSIAARYENVEMIFLKDDDEFIQFLLMLAEKLTDGKEIRGLAITHAKHKDNVYRNVLMSLPNISEEKAKNIEKVYPDFSSLRLALKNGSFKVDGIGAKTTETFLNVFTL
jgi:ERCC4-type nuclease